MLSLLAWFVLVVFVFANVKTKFMCSIITASKSNVYWICGIKSKLAWFYKVHVNDLFGLVSFVSIEIGFWWLLNV